MGKTTDRINWIDWLKVFAMFLVVYAHIDTQSIANRVIFSFHMPLFFMISGFLYKQRSIKDECKVVFRSLFVPYIILSLLLLPFCKGAIGKYVLYISIGSLENVPLLIRPMWFVFSLAMIRLFSSLFGSFQRNVIAAIIALIAFIILSFSSLIPEETDWLQFNTTLMAFPFFVFGRSLNKYFNYIIKYKWVIMALSLPFFYLATANGDVNMFRCTTGNNMLLFYLNALFLSFFCLLAFQTFFSKLSSSVIKTTSMGLIVILASHLLVIMMVDKFTFHTLHPAVLTILVMGIGFGLSWITLRYFPFILGKPFKRPQSRP
ncbi:MAG: acyltransferase family protein [Muribaculaceae bacterium]|nr:acyltransferase family protein [Muribaculaceae bacterium]